MLTTPLKATDNQKNVFLNASKFVILISLTMPKKIKKELSYD